MESNGHTHIDILKLDVEGKEYEVIDELINQSWKLTRKWRMARVL